MLPDRLYGFVWDGTSPQQLRLRMLTMLVFALSMVPLELQRAFFSGYALT